MSDVTPRRVAPDAVAKRNAWIAARLAEAPALTEQQQRELRRVLLSPHSRSA